MGASTSLESLETQKAGGSSPIDCLPGMFFG